MYIITARRMISGLLWKPLKGSVFVMIKDYETTLPASTQFVLTKPRGALAGDDLDLDVGAARLGHLNDDPMRVRKRPTSIK